MNLFKPYFSADNSGGNNALLIPLQVMSRVKSVSGGSGFSLIVKTDATLWSCGANNEGQLGDGTTNDRDAPMQIKF
jgi:alpha-tubulin suppressor-like RCC1 family protein